MAATSALTESAPAMKRLVLCADDFALHASASRGIAALAAQGRISATSAMVLSPRWAADASLLRGLNMDVGLHLDWTSAFAVQAGHGKSLGQAMAAAALGQLKPAQVHVQIGRQLDLFEQHWQAPPDHVDGHQHVQQFAGIREALVSLLEQRYGSAAPYLRVSQAPAGQRDFKSRVIAAMGAERLSALAQKSGLRHSRWLSGVHDFSGRPPGYAERMRGWLQDSPDGTLLMCHPADDVVDDDEIGAARWQEYQHLASPDMAAQLKQHAITLVRGRELFAEAA